ncbi:type I restriction-modification system subunit M [Larsenimonas suaedae]|uniref:site-specific DNA-methyltransferase (adenine-specific) n=1 Tax=Larsenimonas suaedae TaxID=1851019 RepID=A0ABU1GY84_9GAMM|nr:class I SAM-dependent DNA methyltransferase [Larsenimonas suaedae]MCM2972902.1 type I restriction-modification system subunit M [Larsenimonas suaedae]MDR5897001.1 class I SAM-dependent DNA methyltransferase [Larsenimonas suaedae]
MVNGDTGKRLWAAADQLWANTGLKPAEFSAPVLGLIFLRFAEKTYAAAEEKLGPIGSGGRRKVSKADYQAEGVVFLPEIARFSYLQSLTEGDNIGKAINEAMKAIEEENPDLKGALPRTYIRLENWVLMELLKQLGPVDLSGDAFGKIYEYFLGEFALKEGQKGGVFYTPESIVKLIVEVLEPFEGRIYDPACGSGGMFVHSADFVKRHHKTAMSEISIFGTEKDQTTVNLNKMNLAVHGLSGDVRIANTYYEDPFHAADKLGGRFDFVMANPPFNVSGVDRERLEGDPRFPFGIPKTGNANYLWIQLFYASLTPTGRAGFVMANSAGDARASEQTIRQQLIESKAVDVIVSVGPNFFYTVTLPCTLWFFDRAKVETDRADKVLFIDARHIYRQVDRAHRDWLPEQIEFLANIVRLYRGEALELDQGSDALLSEKGLDNGYKDIPGLCKLATRKDIEAQGWSLNPGRYVGASAREGDDVDFLERFEELSEELEVLNSESQELQSIISQNIARIMETPS